MPTLTPGSRRSFAAEGSLRSHRSSLRDRMAIVHSVMMPAFAPYRERRRRRIRHRRRGRCSHRRRDGTAAHLGVVGAAAPPRGVEAEITQPVASGVISGSTRSSGGLDWWRRRFARAGIHTRRDVVHGRARRIRRSAELAEFQIAEIAGRRSRRPAVLTITAVPVLAAADLAAVRVSAPEHGGGMLPRESEWDFDGVRGCDGNDPEGNLFQLREARVDQAPPRTRFAEHFCESAALSQRSSLDPIGRRQ